MKRNKLIIILSMTFLNLCFCDLFPLSDYLQLDNKIYQFQTKSWINNNWIIDQDDFLIHPFVELLSLYFLYHIYLQSQ